MPLVGPPVATELTFLLDVDPFPLVKVCAREHELTLEGHPLIAFIWKNSLYAARE